jgi:hypothetical protein
MCRAAASGRIIGYAPGDWTWTIDAAVFLVAWSLPWGRLPYWCYGWLLPRFGNWAFRHERAEMGFVQN